MWLVPLAGTQFNYTIAGAVLLAVALYVERLRWQIAITVTFAGYAADLAKAFFPAHRSSGVPASVWGLVLLASLAVAVAVYRREQSGRPMLPWAFLLLLWTALPVNLAEYFLLPASSAPSALVERLVFIAGIGLVSWMGWRYRSAPAG